MSEHILKVPDYNPLYDPAVQWASLGEEIVRCRDCAKWSFFNICYGKRIGKCSRWTHLDGFSHATNENGFCAWGERK